MYSFGGSSLNQLLGVHPDLVRVANRAIVITEQDFGVHEGLRTLATQREYVRTGVSKTMDSKHLPQSDGYSHAYDLVPYVLGKLRWEWKPIYVIARAMIISANELGVEMVWGAIWDKRVRELPIDLEGIERAVVSYQVRHPGPDFLDGPHWQKA